MVYTLLGMLLGIWATLGVLIWSAGSALLTAIPSFKSVLDAFFLLGILVMLYAGSLLMWEVKQKPAKRRVKGESGSLISTEVIAIVVSLAVLLALLQAPAVFSVSGDDKPLKEHHPAKVRKGKFVPDEIIVKFRGKPFWVIKVPENKVLEKVEAYKKKENVEYAEPNYYAYALWKPDDPGYGYQWHFDNPEYGGIEMENAWELLGAPGAPGENVIVAIVDTGIAYEDYGWYEQAPDLAETCFVAGYDFINGDNHPNDDSNPGHGTHVAGTVAQSTNNGIGVAGGAFDACLMPVKVLDSSGRGTYANLASGIRWAVNHGADVINLSLGGSEPSATLEDAVAYAYNNGVTVVAAAGNDSANVLDYPAAYDDYVVAVGATQYDENLAPYSNYGPSIDIVAPGGNVDLDQNGDGYGDGVFQQTWLGPPYAPRGWYYVFMSGTSMSTPHASVVAALLIAYGNATIPDEIRAALQETAEDLGADGYDNTFGWGLIDAYSALQWSPIAYWSGTQNVNQTIENVV